MNSCQATGKSDCPIKLQCFLIRFKFTILIICYLFCFYRFQRFKWRPEFYYLSLKKMDCTRICLFSLFFFILTGAGAQQEDFRTVDELFDEFERRDDTYPLGRPGCALAIVRDGEIAYSKGYGMADLEHDIPITPQSVFYAGSVSKQFVATAILLLQEQGKLDIDEDARQYVPELPEYGHTITIRHMLHHVSGLRDYLSLWDLSGRDMLEYIPDEAVLDLIIRQKELNFRPGERYSYSNSGYYLLMLIAERVSGQSFRDFTREHILEPLDMNNSHFHDDLYQVVPNRAWGYRLTDEEQVENLLMRFDLVGSGGLYTTVQDLFKWDQNFYDNKLGKKKQSLIDTLHSDGRLNNGESAGYAFAMVNGEYRGLRTVSHTGSMGGYRAYYLRLPEQQLSVILLGNFANFRPVPYAERIVDILLEEELADVPPATQTAVGIPLFRQIFTEAELKNAPGAYYSPELDARAAIRREENELFLRIGYQPSFSINEWMSQANGRGIDFRSENGEVDHFLLHSGIIKNIHFERVE